MGWRIFLDKGGTFTDVVAEDSSGNLHVEKLLSAPADGSDPTMAATAHRDVDELRIGTTVATNALLERRGARVLLLTTKGFGDILEIASQERPEIFALHIEKRQLLHAAVAEIDERILADGQIERPLDSSNLAELVAGFDHVAVLFLHSWTNPSHELAAEKLLRAAEVKHVTLSHRVAAQIGVVPRGDTTMADAYLTPLLRASVAKAAAAHGRVLCMQSSGGLTGAEHFSGKDAILSGPAGGVVACREVARLAGVNKLIGLDMGGTSTDVCRYDGSFERVYESVTAGVRIATPMLHIVTVAAGGGSVLAKRDGRWVVGPDSAGANPGPACYGRGGPATVTDANLVLGRLRPEDFPHLPLDVQAATDRLAQFGEPRASARGFLAIAIDNMAAAIRRISVGRGYDPREYALCAFGGAGGQHACAVARELGMATVIVHPMAGVLSAFGIGLADVSHHVVSPITTPGFQGTPEFPVEQATEALAEHDLEHMDVLRSVDVRYVGANTTLNVPWGD
ncbi:MAG: 5-oxoprolinase (ATP-hydrolyzing), partial [Pseudohongiellaceae bacterium]